MANKWAVQNGNWSDGSTWNDGVVPTADDYIYCNNKTITTTQNVSEICGTVTNEANAELGINAGGYVAVRQSITNMTINVNIRAKTNKVIQYTLGISSAFATIVGSIYAENTHAIDFPMNNTEHLTINGDITLNNGRIYTTSATQGLFTSIDIIGNIYGSGEFYARSLNTGTITITGNMNGNISYYEDPYFVNPENLIIVGDVILSSNWVVRDTINVTGNILTTNCFLLAYKKAIINGKIEYVSNNGEIGVSAPQIIIVNENTFTWRDATEERSNPFLIFSNKDLENIVRPDYPAETNVLQNVTYGNGDYVGTLEVPPMNVVLEGYQYGDKVGTLKTVPDNVAIVNLTEQEVERVKNCATVSTVQKCFEDFKEE